ncbi:MAG: hypothetical protein ACJAYC_001479 [Halieaceae bacterium]|jgi:hypothetical protein
MVDAKPRRSHNVLSSGHSCGQEIMPDAICPSNGFLLNIYAYLLLNEAVWPYLTVVVSILDTWKPIASCLQQFFPDDPPQ